MTLTLNEGMRYRDLETGTFITRDPAGFVDGPNVYAYVRQNPWSKFDPEGLESALMYYPQGGWDANVRNMQTSKAYQDGFRQGMREGAVMGTALVVGAGVTYATGGLAAPLVSGPVSAALVAGGSGAAGAVAANSTANVLSGKPAMEGTGNAALAGAALGVGGQVIGSSVAAFRSGLAGSAGAVEGSAAATVASSAAEAEAATKTVGRHMNPDELAKMRATGKVQEGGGGQTRVADPADPNAYKNAPKGDVYVEFDVPANRVLPHSQGTGRIPGPNSPQARVPGRNPADYEMPPATNIRVPKPKESHE